MQYRREIDGLRAVAVIPVILFHAGFAIFSGGYIGVDIFFVISGYLITSIIIKELDQGNFSILRFYERRARRILPALFLVMLFCIPFAWMWMLPSQFKDFSQSIVAVTIFASNILFWRESGYFATASEEKPLLHTWSLAVEEQYYLFFPIFLILVWRFGRNPVFYSIIAISIISLLLSEWGWRNKPNANFYLIPTRAWELLAGSICAFLQFGKVQKTNNALSAFGLALIVFALFFYDENTPIPSVYTLVPVFGTALIIMFGAGGTWVAKLLSLKAFVGIGLISYSAYLWHQPLFAFARIRTIYAPEQWLMLVLTITSLILAYFSWRYIERPFRKRTAAAAFSSQRAIFTLSGIVGATLITLGLYGHISQGNVYRYNAALVTKLEESLKANWLPPRCENIGYESSTINPCVFGPYKSNFVIAVVGDSHAQQLTVAFQKISEKNDFSINLYSKYACSVADIEYFHPAINRIYSECTIWRDKVFQTLKQQRPDLVVLTNSSIGYAVDDTDYLGGLKRTFTRLSEAGLNTIYLQDNPQFQTFNPVKCVAEIFLATGSFQEPGKCALSRETALGSFRKQEFELSDSMEHVQSVDLSDIFCDAEQCYAGGVDGVFMMDSNHLGGLGVAMITTEIDSLFNEALQFKGH